MPTAVYQPKTGKGSFQLATSEGMLLFPVGKEVAVTDEVVEKLKTHRHFMIDGRKAEFYGQVANVKANPMGGKPEREGVPELPANGFTSKEDAILYAKTHFGIELKPATALPTMNRKIAEAHVAKFGTEDEPIQQPAADGAEAPADTSKAVDI